MKVFLLHRERDVAIKPELRDAVFDALTSGHLYALGNVLRDLERSDAPDATATSPSSDDLLVQDLELKTLWSAMADGDAFLYETASRVVLSSLHAPEDIVYRQEVLADCLAHPSIVREIYDLAMTALANEREAGSLWTGAPPSSILARSVTLLRLQLDVLTRLHAIADRNAGVFRSEGFTRFFATLQAELSEDYLERVAARLNQLELKAGVELSAELGKGDKAVRYLVHQPPIEQTWRERLAQIATRRPEEYGFELAPRDDAGARALQEIRGRGINHVADATAQSADHVRSFFTMLRFELAFYLGCVNLHDWLVHRRQPVCLPEPLAGERPALTAEDLYDVTLTLHLPGPVVGNDLHADGKGLLVITGANQGGKSTLLRGLGLAQLMMQAGMFVGARSFRADLRSGVFTHFKREEDATMQAGKLDEELARMSRIVDQIRPRAMLLCNESFASTNEREGSEIARQVVRAMLDKNVKVAFVTHMYDLANSLHAQQLDTVLSLRAEREPDGRRTFKLREAEPLPTSYGADSYRRVFGDERVAPAPRAP
jgi:hypothetical protein